MYTMVFMVLIALIFAKGCTVSTIDSSNIVQWKVPTSLPKESKKVPNTATSGNGVYSYKVKGKRYWVRPVPVGYRETGLASWYGGKFHGRLTANQEVYNMYEFTAAHKSLPLPSYIKVFNHNNRKSIIVRVNDRGPFVEGRIVDLSYAAAKRIGMYKAGLALVTIEVIDMPAHQKHLLKVSDSSDKHQIAYTQVGTYKEIANAFNVIHSLKRQNLRPHLRQTNHRSATNMHQVRLGPFNAPQELDTISKLLDRNGFKNHRILYR